MDAIELLQNWYAQHCDGDWEHDFGVQITTLDNPGWMVQVNLIDTDLQDCSFDPIKEEESDSRWLHCFVRDDVWHGAGDETKLNRILLEFANWVSNSSGDA